MLALTFKCVALLLAVSVFCCDARSTFQKLIPNGDKIPHPCKKNTIWQGVGHLNQIGGGKRNPFGNAFAKAGFQWTKALCTEDSDRDGKTNGEELGDPGCIWTEGKVPPKTAGLSHPGICEPVDSPKCSFQSWITCTGLKANCSGKSEPNVTSLVVRMPRTKVPAQLTTYYCKTFLLPHDQDFHVVASDPVLDNTKVIHHMLLFGCNADMVIEKDPFNCIMGSSKCYDIIAGWTVGDEGECFPRQAGYRFGKSIYKYVQLQVHWTNDAKATDLYDSSGIKLYYTSKLRENDLGTITTGQVHLELPPGQASLQTIGKCGPECTGAMLHGRPSVNVTGATLHAHFLGKTLKLAQYRGGKFIRYLAKDDVFSYNNPTNTAFDPPVLLEPGDELRTTCVYDTTKRKKTTYYGDGTYDEMCFGFIRYYPKLPANRQELCTAYERYTFCDIEVFRNASYYTHNFGTCNFTDFETRNYPANILRACGTNPRYCSKDCKHHVDRMNSHRCMKSWERVVYDQLSRAYYNKTFYAVWNAVTICAKTKFVGGFAAVVQPCALLVFLVSLLTLLFHK